MAALSTDAKRLIVRELAMFRTPTEVQQAVQEQHGVTVALSHILYYDPTTGRRDLAAEWRTLFEETRAQFKRDTDGVAIAHRTFRIRELLDLYRRAKTGNRYQLAAQLLEQAAREMGDAYTNVRQLQVGDPVENLARLFGLTPDEVRALLPAADAPAPLAPRTP